MAENNNKAVLQAFQNTLEQRLAGSDADIAKYFHDDIVWHFPQSTASADSPSEHRGKAAVMAMFGGAVEQFYQSSSMRFDYHAWTAEEDRVHLHFTLRAITSTGRDYCNQYQTLFRFCDGLIAEVWEYFDTSYLFAVFAEPAE